MNILFYPAGPKPKNKITQICDYLKIGITNAASDSFEVAINWRGAAWHPRWPELELIAEKGIPVINRHCSNVRKDYVDAVSREIFGYSSLIDPLVHIGAAVEKSNEQAAHNGRIIECPITRVKDNHIYQKLINNQVQEDTYRDIRIPVFGKSIPLVFFKNKDVSIRFTGRSSVSHIIYPSEFNYFFPPGLLDKVLWFCEVIGMDYGEVDLLYDKQENRYYVIDANKTPGNAIFFQFTPAVKKKVIEIMSLAFEKSLLK